MTHGREEPSEERARGPQSGKFNVRGKGRTREKLKRLRKNMNVP